MLDSKIAQPFHALVKTNPKLSGNIKIVVDDDDLFIESIDSNAELSRSVFKAYKVNNDFNLMSNVKNFANLFTNKSDIFAVKQDSNSVAENFHSQHVQLYNTGAYSDTSELFAKRFRYYAPIYMNENAEVPDLFVAYIVDKDDINKPKKLVYVNDLRTSNLGKQLNRHKKYMKDYSTFDLGLYVNFGNHIAVTGTSLTSGLLETRYINDFASLQANERTITEFNSYTTNLFKDNELIDSRYLNIEFCFDIDLSNNDTNDRFLDVIGFYCTLDEFNSIDAFNSSSAAFKVLEDNSNFTISNEIISSSSELADNFVKKNTAYAVEITSPEHPSTYAPLIMIRPMSIPNVGSAIDLSFDGFVQVSYVIQEADIVSNNIMLTASRIAAGLTLAAKANVSDIYVHAFIHDNTYLVIRSLINDKSYDNIIVSSLPAQYVIKQPEFILDGTYNNTFYSPSNTSVLTADIIGMTALNADMLGILNNRGKIVLAAKWLDMYFYNLDSTIAELSNARYIDVISTEKSKMYALNIAEKRAFDFDKTSSYHSDVFDFELISYRQWLIDQIDAESFLGKYTGAPMPDVSTLAAYKVDLKSIVERYFEAINIERSMLFKDINTIDFAATSTINEFDRLAENSNASLIKSNTINQYVNKYMYADGLDVYNRPYTLNLAVPFRYDNFSPSLDSTTRDLRFSTHSWCIIGEGRPPYFSLLSTYGQQIETDSAIPVEEHIVLSDYSNFTESGQNIIANNGTDVQIVGTDCLITGIAANGFADFALTNSDIDNMLNNAVNAKIDVNVLNTAITNCSYDISIVRKRTGSADIILQNINSQITVDADVSSNVITTFNIDLPPDTNSNFNSITDSTVIRIRFISGWTSTIAIKQILIEQTTTNLSNIANQLNNASGISEISKHIADISASYTAKRITKSDILSTNIDVYNFIQSHSILALEGDDSTCFFRGLKIVTDKKYDGWKFSSILLTSTAPASSDRSVELIENEKFKTVTLLVIMYVPEPVLTSLEIPGKYFLDRSLLYFSDGNYASETSLASFGEEPISLIIHDSSTQKYLQGQPVTTDWFYQLGTQNYIHVNRGDSSRFSMDFATILTPGQDFKTFFGNTDDLETADYGIEITFMNIQEIAETYFWCSEIHVRLKETVGLTTSIVEFDMLSEFLSNSNAFLTLNRFDIIEAILYENAKYDKVLRNISAISRFSLLSTASIFDFIRTNNLPLVSTNSSTNLFAKFDAFNQTAMAIAVKLKEQNNSIVQIPEQFVMPIVRQNGKYIATTIQVQSPFKNRIDAKNIIVNNAYKTSNNIVNVQEVTDTDVSTNDIWFFKTDSNELSYNKTYRYYKNKEDYVNLDWWACPNEFKFESSRLLSSVATIEITGIITLDINGNAIIDVYDYVKEYALRLLKNSGYIAYINSLVDADKINILSLHDITIDEQTLHLFSIDEIIVKRFYDACFSKIYTSSKLIINDELIDFVELSNDIIKTVTSVQDGANFNLTITRI